MKIDIKEQLTKGLEMALKSTGITNPSVHMEHPEDISHGDFSTNCALVYSKQLGTIPKSLAEKVIAEFKKEILKDEDLEKNIELVSIAGPGFINIKISRSYFIKETQSILDQKEKYGKQEIGKGKTVLVEYSSPNIAKPFTVGHLRSTIIGDTIANILHFLGYKVMRDNHLGDWGTQFGKLMVALDKWGNLDEIEKNKTPMRELVELYVRFHDEVERLEKEDKDDEVKSLEDEARAKFGLLESGDKEAKKIWKKCVDLSLVEFDNIYKKLRVEPFTTQIGESFFATEEMSKKVLKELETKNLVKESDGAQMVFFENDKFPPLMVRKSDGSSIYATRDLATDLYRKENYDKNLVIINEVGSEQTLYFRQLFEIENLLGWFKEGERIHVTHGLYRFKDGKMSTRKGDVIWLDDLLEEAISRAKKINPESAEDVALAALKFNDLKRDSNQDIIFDWEEMMNTTGDSGPYLQYSATRANSVVEKAKSLNISSTLKNDPEDSKQAENLEKLLVRFGETVERAGKEYKPNILTNYLIELGSQFNTFYGSGVIADDKNKDASHKVALTKAFAIVMENGLKLLGIKVPKRM